MSKKFISINPHTKRDVPYIRHVELEKHSNYHIGGAANFFYTAGSKNQIMNGVLLAKKVDMPIFILGGGTNILFRDEGLNSFVIKINNTDMVIEDGYNIRAGAGVSMENLLAFAVKYGMGGLEWAGGLPGTLGGAIRGNAGAFGGEIKDVVSEVRSIDYRGDYPVETERTFDECEFDYRTSVYRKNSGSEVVIEALLNLKPAHKQDISDAIEEKKAYRAERHPIELPNIGSMFKNVPFEKFSHEHQNRLRSIVKNDPIPVVPAAYLIAQAGLSGAKYGGACVSDKHPNFIVNFDGASSDDIKELVKQVKAAVRAKYQVELELEIEYA